VRLALSYAQPIVGLLAILGVCLLLSRNRRVALRHWRIVAWGLGLQFVFALIVLKTRAGAQFFEIVKIGFLALIGYANEGARFVFGDDLASPNRQPFILAFAGLTVIVFFASLMAVLYHVGLMQLVVQAVAWVMARTMGTSGAESLNAAANIFVGMTEAPFMIRPFLPTLTPSELMVVMTGGFATVAGSVMGLYVLFLQDQVPDIAGHLMAASVMSAPAGLVCAKLLYPETEQAVTAGTVRVPQKSPYSNVLDAATGGASEGMALMLNVIAMLIAFVALVAMANGLLGWVSRDVFGAQAPLTVQQMFGYLFSPLAWLMGVPAGEALEVGQLMGTKTILNEMLGYLQLKEMAGALSDRSAVIAVYSLCGFANLGSVGITVGGLAILAPNRRADLARLGIPAMLAGFLACNMTACFAALLLPTTKMG